MAITINQPDINLIKSALGYPLVPLLEWGEGSDDYVRDYVVARVLREYFKWFPLKSDFGMAVNGAFVIPYPAPVRPEWTIFGVLRHYFNYKTELETNMSSPFFLQTQVIGLGSSQNGGSPWRQSDVSEFFSRQATIGSIVENSMAVRVEDYPNEREVRGSSNTWGTLSIQFANFSENFNDIPYHYREDALKLSRAYLLQDSYRLREQVKIQSKVEINSQVFLDQATKWEDEVMAKWRSSGRALIVK